jgi:hypothetical protein
VVRLPPRHYLLAIKTILRKIIWEVHPVYSRINMSVVQGSNLKNLCYLVQFTHLIGVFFDSIFSTDTSIVGDVDKVVAVVIDFIYYRNTLVLICT